MRNRRVVNYGRLCKQGRYVSEVYHGLTKRLHLRKNHNLSFSIQRFQFPRSYQNVLQSCPYLQSMCRLFNSLRTMTSRKGCHGSRNPHEKRHHPSVQPGDSNEFTVEGLFVSSQCAAPHASSCWFCLDMSSEV